MFLSCRLLIAMLLHIPVQYFALEVKRRFRFRQKGADYYRSSRVDSSPSTIDHDLSGASHSLKVIKLNVVSKMDVINSDKAIK